VVKNGYSGEILDSQQPEVICQAITNVLNNPEKYSKKNCLSAVSEYTPKKVLAPLYSTIRKLNNEIHSIS